MLPCAVLENEAACKHWIVQSGDKKVLEYDVCRKDVFPWHIPVYAEEATPRAKL